MRRRPPSANLTTATSFCFEPLVACPVNVGGSCRSNCPAIASSGLNGAHMIGKVGLLIGTVGLCSSLGASVHAQTIDSPRLGPAVSTRVTANDEPADFQSLVSPIKYRRGRVVVHRRARFPATATVIMIYTRLASLTGTRFPATDWLSSGVFLSSTTRARILDCRGRRR